MTRGYPQIAGSLEATYARLPRWILTEKSALRYAVALRSLTTHVHGAGKYSDDPAFIEYCARWRAVASDQCGQQRITKYLRRRSRTLARRRKQLDVWAVYREDLLVNRRVVIRQAIASVAVLEGVEVGRASGFVVREVIPGLDVNEIFTVPAVPGATSRDVETALDLAVTPDPATFSDLVYAVVSARR